MTIEPVIELFGQYNGKVTQRLREVIFEEYAKSDGYGMIFTFMWAFDQPSEWAYVEHICDIFRQQNAEIYYAELVASQAVRLERNATENRLRNKTSKRDIEASNQRLLHTDEVYRCVSNEGEIPFADYIKIDNSALAPDAVARMIRGRFLVETHEKRFPFRQKCAIMRPLIFKAAREADKMS